MDQNPPASDAISFGTDGWRAPVSEFTVPRIRMVGQAVASYLADTGDEGPVAVGYDAREHSREFARELTRVLAANGRAVTISDRDCPTPVLAWTVANGPYTGGLMITASHNPPEYNGVKILREDGSPALPGVTDAIEARLETPEPVDPDSFGSVTESDLRSPYVDHAHRFVMSECGAEQGLSGMTVAYDAMHGSGRDVTDRLLERGGASVERLRCGTHPTFGGVAPEPSPENASALEEIVSRGAAELGVINDGDADRIGLVTPRHGYLDPNVVLAVLYEYLLSNREADAVRTVSTGSLVDRIATAHDQQAHETAVGFKWVADVLADHDAVFGGEESGGYGVGGHLRNKDGVLIALLAAVAHRDRSLDARIKAVRDAHGSVSQGRVSVACPNERKPTVLERVEQQLPEELAGQSVAEVNTVDGFKIHFTDGTWVLIRPSGTEPKLRVYAEAEEEARVDALLTAGRDLVEPLVGD